MGKDDDFVPAGGRKIKASYRPQAHHVACTPCSKLKPYASSEAGGYFFDPARGQCPRTCCTWKPGKNANTFADTQPGKKAPPARPANPKDSPKSGAPPPNKAVSDAKQKQQQAEKENAKLRAEIKHLKGESAGKV